MEVILGLVAALKANTTLATLTSSKIYDFEIPTDEDLSMPEKLIVVRPLGGPRNFQMLQLNDSRVQLICYGETPHLAYSVYAAAYAVFKAWTPSVWAQTYVHWVNEESGPLHYREAELQWPYNVTTWMVRASDLVVS